MYQEFYENKDKMHNYDGNVWTAIFGNKKGDALLGAEAGVFRLLLNVSVFAAGVAILAAVLLLAISASGGTSSKTFQEAKKWIVRIIVISVLIFATTGLITLVGVIGLD